MNTIGASQAGLSVLDQQNTGLLSTLPINLPSQTLQNASQQDIVALSDSALQLQLNNGLLGLPTTATSQFSNLLSFAQSSNPAEPITPPTGQAAVDYGNNSQLQQIESLFSSQFGPNSATALSFLG